MRQVRQAQIYQATHLLFLLCRFLCRFRLYFYFQLFFCLYHLFRSKLDEIEKQVNGAMKNEISKFTATVDTGINIASGAEQVIYLDILPKGYLTNIRVVLGFKAG